MAGEIVDGTQGIYKRGHFSLSPSLPSLCQTFTWVIRRCFSTSRLSVMPPSAICWLPALIPFRRGLTRDPFLATPEPRLPQPEFCANLVAFFDIMLGTLSTSPEMILLKSHFSRTSLMSLGSSSIKVSLHSTLYKVTLSFSFLISLSGKPSPSVSNIVLSWSGILTIAVTRNFFPSTFSREKVLWSLSATKTVLPFFPSVG